MFVIARQVIPASLHATGQFFRSTKIMNASSDADKADINMILTHKQFLESPHQMLQNTTEL